MTYSVPQPILDALTDVDMPPLNPGRGADEHVDINGLRLPVHRTGCIVVGSGAAGLRAAVELARRGIDVTIISQSAWGGTSACSGSDKQTLHTANTADVGDNFWAMAQAIAAGGAMDADLAYVEAVGSPRMMATLQFMGLPLPQDRLGGVLRYKTDHDEAGRATSCGPRTSRLMVKALAEEALRLGIPLRNHTTAIEILVNGSRAAGILAIGASARSEANPYGFVILLAPSVVLAAGGPGELYRDSVYPNACFGALGLAAEAGLGLVNLTESQFGIGTRREGFPWNLSGTYMQVIPYIYSVDDAGQEHNFLALYYCTTQELASNIFRKGYQWPFHASRMLDFGSSLIDLAIFRETQARRRVFMDFNRNPAQVPGDEPFSLERLDDDVSSYLSVSGATHALPIDRLRHMNPLAIELYRRYKVDIETAPLEFAVNNQHMNGGIAVDSWGRSSLDGCYAVGEAAGTHGVTRPGGAALNAGQVFGTRVAEHIAASRADPDEATDPATTAASALRRALSILRPEGGRNAQAIRAEIQARMSDHAGMICYPEAVSEALSDARALMAEIDKNGIGIERAAEASRALQWRQMALASVAVLTALDAYIVAGGGSRGARAICSSESTKMPFTRLGPLSEYSTREERPEDRDNQIVLQRDGNSFAVRWRPITSVDRSDKTFFERDWPDWLTGRIFELNH